MPMYQRIANAWITLFFVRMKYYFAWKVITWLPVDGRIEFKLRVRSTCDPHLSLGGTGNWSNRLRLHPCALTHPISPYWRFDRRYLKGRRE